MWFLETEKQINVSSVISTTHTQDGLLHLGSWEGLPKRDL